MKPSSNCIAFFFFSLFLTASQKPSDAAHRPNFIQPGYRTLCLTVSIYRPLHQFPTSRSDLSAESLLLSVHVDARRAEKAFASARCLSLAMLNPTPWNDLHAGPSSSSASRPTTRDGSTAGARSVTPTTAAAATAAAAAQSQSSSSANNAASATTGGKDRKSSFSRKAAAALASPRRRTSSNAGLSDSSNNQASNSGAVYRTDAAVPPALPDYALSAAAKVAPGSLPLRSPGSPGSPGKMLNRTVTSSSAQSAQAQMPPPPTPLGGPGGGANGGGAFWQSSDANSVHSQITELATKRIGTLDYLRRAYATLWSTFHERQQLTWMDTAMPVVYTGSTHISSTRPTFIACRTSTSAA